MDGNIDVTTVKIVLITVMYRKKFLSVCVKVCLWEFVIV